MTRQKIKSLLIENPRLFEVARRVELYASALFRRIHDEEYRVIAAVSAPKVIADVGANLGQSIASFARIFPLARYHAFEPNPVCERTIRTVARLARVEATVHACGLGAHAAELKFYTPVVAGSALLQEGSFDASVFSHPVTIARIGAPFILATSDIPVRKLDDFPDDYDLIKVDAQGFELAVMHGAAETLRLRKPVIFVENGPDTPAVAQFLRKSGYRNATSPGMTLNSLFVVQ